MLSHRSNRALPAFDPFRILALCAVFSFGFFLQFNIMTSTFGLPFMRLTDALLFVYTPYFFLLVGIGLTLRYGLPYFIILFAIISATLLLKTSVERGDVYFTLIYVLTGVFCFYFAMIAREDTFLIYFAAGILLGLIPSLIVLLLQASGRTSLPMIGLGVPADQYDLNSAILAKVKPGGLWSHGNEAGHVYALATGAALYLALRFRRPSIYVAGYGLLLASFTVTLNRAGLIAPTIALIYCYVRLGDLYLYVKTAVIGIIVVLILAMGVAASGVDVFSDAIQKRFFADYNASENVADRLQSNVAGLEVTLEHPFGIGYHERRLLVNDSLHNGFLSLADQSGIAISLWYILSGIYLIIRRRHMHSFYIIMFLFTATSMLFEELSINQFFIFSVALTIAAGWVDYAKQLNWNRPRRMTLSGRRSPATPA